MPDKLNRIYQGRVVDCKDQQVEYQKLKIAEMEERQQDRGYSIKREKLINAMYRANPLRRIIDITHAEAIMQAHKRHTETN